MTAPAFFQRDEALLAGLSATLSTEDAHNVVGPEIHPSIVRSDFQLAS